MPNYKMTVEIPILNVPDNISIQEAKATAEVWLKQKIPDATLIEFKVEEPCQTKK